MKPISLMLAGVFAILPCSCKKDENTQTKSVAEQKKAATKSFERTSDAASDEVREQLSGKVELNDPREIPELVAATELDFEEIGKLSQMVADAEAQERHATSVDHKDEAQAARDRAAELSLKLNQKNRNLNQAIAILRSRSSRDQGNKELESYIGYFDQRTSVSQKQREIQEEMSRNPNSDTLAKMQEELFAEMGKLRERRSEWKVEP